MNRQPKIRGKKHHGLYIRNGIWYRRWGLDGKMKAYSTGVPVEWVRKPKGDDPGLANSAPPDVYSMVPRGREKKEEAERALSRRTAHAAQGPTGLLDFAAEYLDRQPEPADIKTRRINVGHLTKFFKKGTDLADINKTAALRYHQFVAKRYLSGIIAGRTGNMWIAAASHLFAHAIKYERIPGPNPFANMDKFPEKQREFVLDILDEPIFLDCCPSWLRFMVEDNLYLGLRAGEARGLKRGAFRPTEGAHGYIVLNVADTKGGRLKAARGRSDGPKEARIALIREVRDRMRSRLTSLRHDFFYSGPRGGPVAKDTMEKAIKRAWEKAEPLIAKRRGIPLAEFRAEVAEKGGFVFHSTRHTAATRDAMAGLTILDLMMKYRFGPRMAERYVHGNDAWSEMAAQKRAEAEG